MNEANNMDAFEMNGYFWNVVFVRSNSPMLIDRTNTLTIATTDANTLTVYLSNKLRGDFLMRVFLHELGHCTLYSFHLIDDIHKMVYPEYWVDAEEWVCNFIADFGFKIFKTAFKVLGYDAWKLIPKEIEKMIA